MDLKEKKRCRCELPASGEKCKEHGSYQRWTVRRYGLDGYAVKDVEEVTRYCLSPLCDGHLVLLDRLGIIRPTELRDELITVLFDDEAYELLKTTSTQSLR